MWLRQEQSSQGAARGHDMESYNSTIWKKTEGPVQSGPLSYTENLAQKTKEKNKRACQNEIRMLEK